MREFVTADDLKVINKALNEEKDVRIQRTRDGYRIVEDTVRVLLKNVGAPSRSMVLIKQIPVLSELLNGKATNSFIN